MNLWEIVKSVGATALNVALPGAGSAVLSVVNAVLGDDGKLPDDATGHDIDNALHKLPPEVRAKVMSKKFDVDITQIKESYSANKNMITEDAKSTHTTRPYIAKGSFQVVAFTIVTTVSTWTYGVIQENDSLVQTVMNGWPFILAVMGPLVILLHAYFGVLKQEHKNRLDAATGNKSTGVIGGILSKLIGGK